MKIIILGAGISGLAAAWQLEKLGHEIVILEKSTSPGGSMQSRIEDGFLVDYGPNSGLETTPVLRRIAEDTGIDSQLIYADKQASKRYILRNGRLHALPMGPKSFLSTDLFSIRAKLRLMMEPFIGKSDDGYYQSISQFVRRRLGKEFLDYAINPFVAGIFAGNPDKLSVKSAFPRLYRLEEVYGGLIKGMIKGAKERKKNTEKAKNTAQMFSFLKGMQTLPEAIASKLNGTILYGCEVQRTGRSGEGYFVEYLSDGVSERMEAPVVISALPSYILSRIACEMDAELSEHLDAIYYPPVRVLYLGYRKEDIGRELDGFGFLIPQKEKKLFLGAIWSSSIFPERAPGGCAAFTLFIGGARSPEMTEVESSVMNELVIEEFSDIMNITGEPVFIRERTWDKAIPQYNLGYIEHERYFDEFEKNNKGFIISGNFRGGISVGDCLKNSEAIIKKIVD